MFLPYSTDAPLRYRPFGTIGMIALNLLVFALQVAGVFDAEPLALHYGTINPLQWVTSIFIHADALHVISNMVFMWVFGLIVEGRVGTGKFLAIYMSIGVLECAVEQVVLLGVEGASVGASSVIYGLLGVCLIWAPKNDVNVLWIFLVRGGVITLTVQTLALVYFGIEVAYALLYGAANQFITSELLHLLGAAAGVFVGVVMLKKGWVDCEHWDWFSVRRGEHLRQGMMLRKKDPFQGPYAPPSTPAQAEQTFEEIFNDESMDDDDLLLDLDDDSAK